LIPIKVNNYSHIELLKKLAQKATGVMAAEKTLKKPVPQISHPKTVQTKPPEQKKIEKLSSFEDIAIKYASFLDKFASSILPSLNIKIDEELKKEAIKFRSVLKWVGLPAAGYFFGYRHAKRKYGPPPPPEIGSPSEYGGFLTPELERGRF